MMRMIENANDNIVPVGSDNHRYAIQVAGNG